MRKGDKMQINRINNYINVSKIQNITKFQNKNIFKSLNKDIVSFSGLNLPTEKNPNVKEATKLGLEIYDLEYEDCNIDKIKEIINVKDYIKLKPISELKNQIDDSDFYVAHFLYRLNDKFEPMESMLFISEKLQQNSDIYKLRYAMEVAHEYTHLKQFEKGIMSRQLKKVASDDLAYSALIMGLGNEVFKKFETVEREMFMSGVFDMKTLRQEFNEYGFILPKEKNFNKQQILSFKDLKNEVQFKNYNQEQLSVYLMDRIEAVLNDEITLEYDFLKDMLRDIIKNPVQVKKLKDDIKQYCKDAAYREKEAYTTESVIVKKVMKTNKTLDIDFFPVYYEMLEKAL